MPSRIEEGPLDADGKQKCNLSTDYKEVRNCLREQEKTKVLLSDQLKVNTKSTSVTAGTGKNLRKQAWL